jgi:hypothetical protein
LGYTEIMTSTYLIRHIILTADWQGLVVSPTGTDPRVDQESMVPLERFCAEEGVEFIGWHPIYTLLGVFRKPSDQEVARAALLDEALARWAQPDAILLPSEPPQRQRSV